MTSEFPKNMTVKQAVLATLAYFDLFGVPLTRSEISEHLFFIEPDEEKIDIYLRESPLIQLNEGYFSLGGDKDFYDRFFEKQNRALKYWKKVRRFYWFFSLCPFIELICVCNSLPIYAVEENSDIDLFIVTKKNRLFLARIFISLISSLLRIRRHGNKISERFCLSFYVTEENMDMKKVALEPYDIYLAYWLKTMEPISGNYEVYQKLIDLNRPWLNEYFKKIQEHKRYFRKPTASSAKWKERLERWINKDEWEEKTKKSQLRRAKEKYLMLQDKSGTILSDTVLKFHNRDERADFRKEWTTRLNQLL